MEFDKLVTNIQNIHGELQGAAVRAVNQSLTIRNWLIGYYIVEFEQHGEDRAILDTDYMQPYIADKRKNLAIGIAFSSQERKVSSYIVEEIA